MSVLRDTTLQKQTTWQIYPLISDHLKSVTNVHLRAFPRSALSQLGSESVFRYYKWQVEGPHDLFAIALMSDNQLVGYCFAGSFNGALSGFLNANWNYLIRRIMLRPYLIFNPLIRTRIWSTLKRLVSRRQNRKTKPTSQTPDRFGILAIAVDPDVQGHGAGKAMMDAAENQARSRGFSEIVLTVQPTNTRAVRFYEKFGWSKVLAGDKWAGKMQKQI
jgi:ribosomal protein S18 acetylase RimI-like enzyme